MSNPSIIQYVGWLLVVIRLFICFFVCVLLFEWCHVPVSRKEESRTCNVCLQRFSDKTSVKVIAKHVQSCQAKLAAPVPVAPAKRRRVKPAQGERDAPAAFSSNSLPAPDVDSTFEAH
jgi:hypothetical protein